jgi:hypothetical protein
VRKLTNDSVKGWEEAQCSTSGGGSSSRCSAGWRAAWPIAARAQQPALLAAVSIPLLGTGFVQTPQVSALRAIPHTIFFLLAFYFGFIWKKKN